MVVAVEATTSPLVSKAAPTVSRAPAIAKASIGTHGVVVIVLARVGHGFNDVE